MTDQSFDQITTAWTVSVEEFEHEFVGDFTVAELTRELGLFEELAVCFIRG